VIYQDGRTPAPAAQEWTNRNSPINLLGGSMAISFHERRAPTWAIKGEDLAMRLDIIENNGPDNLRDALRSQLRRASEVSIAVAFVSKAGLDEVLQSLRQVAAIGNVRLLTGLYQKITEPEALKTLLRAPNKTPK
jgi:hypothetical protein